MAMKYNDAVALYQQTLKQLQQPQEWERFLQTAAKLYKYPFRDQVMIYAQRPDATAVASFDVWSLTMVRRIKAGTKGIALFDDNGERGKLKYGFDIADTIANSNSYVPNQWKFKLSDTEELERYIGETYNIPKQESLAQQIVLLSKRICSTSIERPSLERYNEPNEWRKSVSSSVAYIILERCGLQHDLHPVLPESISEDMLVELGASVNLVSKNLLTQIYQTIKKKGVSIMNTEKTIAEQMGIQYIKKGEQYYPALTVKEYLSKPLGKFGKMRRKFLEENRPIDYEVMFFKETLYEHLQQVDEEAEEMLESLIKEMAKAEGVNEAMKCSDQMGWVARMNNIKSRATEIVIEELINS